MESDLFDNDKDFSAPDEGVEIVSESVTEEEVATPQKSVVKSSTRSKPKTRKATRRKATKKVAKPAKVSAPKTVAIQCIYPGTVMAECPGGERYRWEAPGVVLQVAKSDVDYVMSKNGDGTRECCGSSSTPVYFVIVD